MSFQIREATYEDYSAINNLIIEVHNLHCDHRPDVYAKVDTPLTKEHYHAMLMQDQLKIFVAEDSSSHEVIGYSSLKLMSSPSLSILVPTYTAYVNDFCIKSTYKRQGAGKLLFDTISNYAKGHGAQSIQLTVWEFNKDALEFYTALGMRTRNCRLELDL